MVRGSFIRAVGAAAPFLVLSLFASSAMGQIKWQSGFTNVDFYDAGVDVNGDGTNDAPTMPFCTGGAALGFGLLPVCADGSSIGTVCNDFGSIDADNCPGSVIPCGAATSVDGVTAADSSSRSVIAKKSKCAVKGGDADKSKGISVKAQVTFDGTVPGDTNPVGVCSADSATACKKDKDCDGTAPCVSGDEFWVQFEFIASPPSACSPACVGSISTGPPLSLPRSCAIGACVSLFDGSVTGLCDTGIGIFVCPGGSTCQAGVGAPTLPGVGTGISFSISDGDIEIFCPVMAGLSLPGEVKKGKMKVQSKDILGVFGEASVPDTTSIDVRGCYLHDQAYNSDQGGITPPGGVTAGVSSTLPLGIFVGTLDDSCAKTPCPSATAPIDAGQLNVALGPPPGLGLLEDPLLVNQASSAIIAVSGGSAGKL